MMGKHGSNPDHQEEAVVQRKLALLDRAQWAEKEEIWKGEFEGNVFGTNVSVIFYTTDEVGRGPKRALLPDLVGKDVLDLGCGFGDFARYARQQGARTVTALDVSERMIAEAKRLTGDDAIIFVCSAIEDFAGRPETFNLIVSSMALHYVQPFKAVVRRIFEALTPGGCFIFSVEHPICTANPKGWVRNPQGKALHWPVDRYQEEGERRTSWFVDGVVKFHRTTETYVDTLIDAGFRLRGLREPQAQPSFLDARPWLQETLRRPPVLMLAASRPPSPSL